MLDKKLLFVIIIVITTITLYFIYLIANMDIETNTTNLKYNEAYHTQKNIAILAFGDSLTEGLYDSNNWRMHPYTLQLKALLDQQFSDHQINIINKGICGDKAANMKSRLEKALLDKPTIAIILAGTNDLGVIMHLVFQNQLSHASKNVMNTSNTVTDIFHKISLLHDTCHKHSVKTIMLTIPEIYIEEEKDYNVLSEVRIEINKRLKQYAEDHKNLTFFLDLANEIPQLKLSKEEKKIWWADGVHFTQAGYDKMGQLIFSALKDILS